MTMHMRDIINTVNEGLGQNANYGLLSISDDLLLETAMNHRQAVLQMIRRCRSHFGENVLFYGNCGLFAIALSKWATTALRLEAGLAGVLVVFEDDASPLPLSNVSLGRTFTHVFSVVKINGRDHLFDGSGAVSKKTVDQWFKKAHDEYEPDGDPDEMPDGIELVQGDLSERCIDVIIEGTDHAGDWQEFYQFMVTQS